MSWCWRSALVSMNEAMHVEEHAENTGEIPAKWRLVVLSDAIAIRFQFVSLQNSGVKLCLSIRAEDYQA
jgi:hypothetical protein